MSALISNADGVGIWMSNGARDCFLDWYADHRCTPGDDLAFAEESMRAPYFQNDAQRAAVEEFAGRSTAELLPDEDDG